MQVAALRRADPLSKESYRLYVDQVTEKATMAQQRAVEPWIDIYEEYLASLYKICTIFSKHNLLKKFLMDLKHYKIRSIHFTFSH
jgi:hypothetical protein